MAFRFPVGTSHKVLPVATGLARAVGARATLLYVAESGRDVAQAQGYLAGIASRPGISALRPRIDVRVGSPPEQVTRTAPHPTSRWGNGVGPALIGSPHPHTEHWEPMSAAARRRAAGTA